MNELEFLGINWQVWFVLGLIVTVFVSFLREKLSPDIIAMGGFSALLALGIIDQESALSVFSNPAPITIGAMFIVSAALERTGCVEYLGRLISRYAGKTQFSLLLAVIPVVLVISAFMNNTPVVILLTPVMIGLAQNMNLSSSKILIPLSFTSILGGMTTLIGTSTNLLVNGIAINAGIEGFSMFEITLPGIIMAAVGSFFIIFVGRHMLPERQTLAGMLGTQERKNYTIQLFVPHDSKLIGQTLASSSLAKSSGTDVIDILRHGDSMKLYMDEMELQAGDRLIVESSAGELLGIKETGEVKFAGSDIYGLEPMSAEELVIVEGVVGPHSNLIGKFASGLKFATRYSVKIVGVHKPEKYFVFSSGRHRLNVGDAVLLEGPVSAMKGLFNRHGLINLSVPDDKPIRRRKAPIAIATVVGVVGLSALGVFPIALAAIIGAFLVVVSRCIDPDDVYKVIDWPILFLIFGMLGVSEGMAATGTANMIVAHVVNLADAYGPLAVMAALYLLTSFLTEMVSNTAVAALIAPIAISLAAAMGIDPKPFLVAVMFAGSASFATPIGYQTNTFVYGAGGYKFRDFLWIGLSLNLIMFALAMFLIPVFWPFATG